VNLPEPTIRALLAIGVIAAIAALGFALVRWAKHGKSRQTAGVMLMLFSWGHMRDPRNDTVAEARDGRIRKEESAGNSLDEDSRQFD
jgi:hypothetical protein